MNITLFQITLYIIFIISIIIIGYYSLNTLNNTESFDIGPVSTQPQNTEPLLTLTDLQLENELNNIDIKDISVKNKLIDYLKTLYNIIDKYKTIDAPITVNNNGTMCENWNMYDNGKYKADGNSCIKLDGKGNRKCLNNNILVSCNNYFKDGKINNLNSINIKEIFDSAKYNMLIDTAKITEELYMKKNDIDIVLNDLIAKRNLENQQLYFIDYNNNNLDDKKKIFNKYNEDFEKSENEVNINKIQFQQFLETNQSMTENKNKYYNYMIWIIILIFIVGILNFLFTEIL